MTSNEPTRYFEDWEVGETFEFGAYTVTRDEIIEFAEQYDPQPFHVDEGVARESVVGRLIASGWHTAAICQRLLVDGLIKEMASAGGRGVDELRWWEPVRPGDVLTLCVEIVEKHAPEDAREPGEVHAEVVGYNQDDDPVISYTVLGMIERRESG